MVLGFKEQFKPLILAGTKIHTIRADSKDRWRQGMRIHMATGVRTKRYECFCDKYRVESIQSVRMQIDNNYRVVVYVGEEKQQKVLTKTELERLVGNDGFNNIALFEAWFYSAIENCDGGIFKGKIIHWTDYRY